MAVRWYSSKRRKKTEFISCEVNHQKYVNMCSSVVTAPNKAFKKAFAQGINAALAVDCIRFYFRKHQA